MARPAYSLAAALLLACLILAPYTASARPVPVAADAETEQQRRALLQVDPSIRQENAKFKVLSALRKTGGDAGSATVAATGSLGKGNFEKSADLHTANNLNMNLRRYARPTDNGPRGQVAARIHSKLAKNYDGDVDDGLHFVQQAAQKNIRLTMLRSDTERAGLMEGDKK